MSKNFFLVFLVLYTVAGVGQPPVAQRPQTYIDTSFNPPTGVSWKAHTSTDFKKALESANPGDTIVLDAGATYQGNFNLPAKTNPNNKWIYIVGSSLASLPAPGTRVNPATDAAKMPKIVTPNSVDTIELLSGANHYRFVGIEFYSASTVGCNPKAVPPVNCFTSGGLISSHAALNNLPDSIFIDRCYIHGQPNIDVHRGVQMIGTNFAIVDSYINEIHMQGTETQAAGGWWGNGPFKIVNNYLSAAGEVVMFGGSGGVNNPTVPSDIEIRNNYFYLPLAWDAPGISLPPNPTMTVKNLFELKSARRVLFDSNLLENIWPAAQTGFAMNIKVGTGGSGNIAVTDDITITNNVIKNASSGVNFSPHEPYCSQVPGCTSTGEVLRVIIRNNLFLLGDTTQPGWSKGYGMGILINPPNATDLVFQHNTVVPPPNLGYCVHSVYFGAPTPPVYPLTHNVWIVDNVLCRQVRGGGSNGFVGQFPASLTNFMGNVPPVSERFAGNVMFLAASDKEYPLPPGNHATSSRPKDAEGANYYLKYPAKISTTDGQVAGVDKSKLAPAFAAESGAKVPSLAEASTTGSAPQH